MKITNVEVREIKDKDLRIKGIASVLIDDYLAIHDIRIIEGDKGLFLAMPSRKTANGDYKDIFHPINSETRKMFEEAIFEEINKVSESDE